MKRIAFVILHYNTIEVTEACIASLLALEGGPKKGIVIVDNGSPNGSGRTLKEKYREHAGITVLESGANLGFARGNNLGYVYARETLHADCIVIANNDIIFEQKDFAARLDQSCERTGACVLGPDIVNLEGTHQNPFRTRAHTLSDVKKLIRNKRVFLAYFYLKKWLHLGDKIHILEDMFDRKSERRRTEIAWNKQQKDVVLQGACLIFLPDFIRQEDKAFCPDTFMYGEEDILAYLCRRAGHAMVYDPALRVLHMDGKTTKNSFGKSLDKEIFVYKNTLESFRVLKRLMTTKPLE